MDMLHLLLNGSYYHKHIARLILNGELIVRWDANLPATRGGEWVGGNTIYLNPNIFRQRPQNALMAASVVVHEATHAMGGGEPMAHIAQGAFMHLWGVQRGRRYPLGVGRQAGHTYVVRDHYAQLTIAVERLYKHQDILALGSVMRGNPQNPLYGVDVSGQGFYIKNNHIGALNRYITNAGGWGQVLNLDPGTAQLLDMAGKAHGGVGL